MKMLIVGLMAAFCFAGTAQAQIPVTVTSDLPGTLQHVETTVKWKAQYDQMVTQIDQLKQQYTAISGSYGRGRVGLQDAIDAVSVVPGSWQDVVSRQKKGGGFGAWQDYYEVLLNNLPDDAFANPQGRNARSYKMSSDSVRGAMAAGDALYRAVQVNLTNLAKLGRTVDSTANIKDAQDLQNRIATENGMLQTAVAKMTALNVNLQANLLNSENQARAGIQKHFQSSKE